MRRFLFDTAIFLYAMGRPSPYREPCRAIVDRQRRGQLRGEASVELAQELLYVLRRRGHDPSSRIGLVRSVVEVVVLHDFERRDLDLTLRLLSRHRGLDERDAVHAATALNRGIDAIVSPDRDLDVVPGLTRIDPCDAAAIAELTG